MKNRYKIIITLTLLLTLTSCISLSGYLENRYVKISDNVLPSVVEVISIGLKDSKSNNWFDYFQDQEENRIEDFDSNGIGSGVIIEGYNNSYYILTNKHVVGDLEEVLIVLHDKSEYRGEVLGYDQRFDLAVVKIHSLIELPVAKINVENNLKVGQFVAALGSPMGYVQSISMGVISHLGRFGGPKGNISNFIQTDASINQGNSGGPLVNLKGEVIGINTWISSPSGGSVGLGFSVPISNIYPSFRSIVDKGQIVKSWIGISTGQVPGTNFYTKRKGAFVYQVILDSPAYLYSIKPGDIITKINETDIESSQELILTISLLKPNDEVIVTIKRDNKELIVLLKLEHASSNILETSKKINPGFILTEDSDNVILLEVLSKSIGQKSGFKKNDKIISINNTNISKIHELYPQIKKGINKVVISRDEKELELELNY